MGKAEGFLAKAKISVMVTITVFLTGCGGGSGGSGDPAEQVDSSGFEVPSASGDDGLDKVISLLNVKNQSHASNGVSGAITDTRSELAKSTGCLSGTTRSRSDFSSASSITNDQVCAENECASAGKNSLLVTQPDRPDVRRDTVFFFDGTIEVASNANEFEVKATREQSCSLEGPTPSADFPSSIEGVYKGFVYQRENQSLNRSSLITLDCADNECVVQGDVAVDDNLTLEPEGAGAAKFMWEDLSLKLASGEPQKRFNGIFSASQQGDFIGGVGIPLDGSPICSRDCVTIALEKQ